MSAGTGLDTRARLLVIVYDAPLSIAARSREHFGLGLLNKRARSDVSLTSLMTAVSNIQACARAVKRASQEDEPVAGWR
jgi:hypothetical protein